MNGILLIARQHSIVEYFTEMLKTDYEVWCVQSEADGLAILKENSGMIAAVLIELRLARETGFAFAEQMRAFSRFSSIPMIAISDALPTPLDMDSMDHGFYDLITAFAPRALVLKRIGNAILAKDSLSLTELERMMKQLPACVFLKDTEGRYVFSTQYWRHLNTGDDPNWTIRGKTDLDIRRDRDNALKAMEADRRILESGEGTEYIIQENEDGIREYLQLIKRPVYDESGNISGIIALINNVTDYQLLKQELEKRARTDALTGLLNKNAAQELIDMLLETYHREGERCALMMIDADHFKAINDTFGHAEGDRVLSTLGRIIRDSCRSDDVAGRIGGDEFIVFLRGIGDAGNAAGLARRLRAQVRAAFENTPLAGQVTLSIGIALFPDHGRPFDDLYRSADQALYEVKHCGRDGYRVCGN